MGCARTDISTEAEIFSYFLSPLSLWERGWGEGKYRKISASVLISTVRMNFGLTVINRGTVALMFSTPVGLSYRKRLFGRSQIVMGNEA